MAVAGEPLPVERRAPERGLHSLSLVGGRSLILAMDGFEDIVRGVVQWCVMRTKSLLTLVVAMGLGAFATSARAGVSVQFSFGFPAIIHVEPACVPVVLPPPPPVVCAKPAVIVQPRPHRYVRVPVCHDRRVEYARVKHDHRARHWGGRSRTWRGR